MTSNLLCARLAIFATVFVASAGVAVASPVVVNPLPHVAVVSSPVVVNPLPHVAAVSSPVVVNPLPHVA